MGKLPASSCAFLALSFGRDRGAEIGPRVALRNRVVLPGAGFFVGPEPFCFSGPGGVAPKPRGRGRARGGAAVAGRGEYVSPAVLRREDDDDRRGTNDGPTTTTAAVAAGVAAALGLVPEGEQQHL